VITRTDTGATLTYLNSISSGQFVTIDIAARTVLLGWRDATPAPTIVPDWDALTIPSAGRAEFALTTTTLRIRPRACTSPGGRRGGDEGGEAPLTSAIPGLGAWATQLKVNSRPPATPWAPSSAPPPARPPPGAPASCPRRP